MSVEQAKAFIERMKMDEAFREKVMSIEDAAGRIACIQSEGFDCTPEEIIDEDQVVSYDAVVGGMSLFNWLPGGDETLNRANEIALNAVRCMLNEKTRLR